MLDWAAPAAAQNLALEPVAEGLTAPLHLEEPADGSGRKFIVQQNGVVLVLGPDGRLVPEPFLDLRPRCCRSSRTSRSAACWALPC
jgi:hypothetical protein